MKGNITIKALVLLVLAAVLISFGAVGCLDQEIESDSSEVISIIDIFSHQNKSSSQVEINSKTPTSSKAATSTKVEMSSKTSTSSKTEIVSKAETSSNTATSSEKINFYNSGVFPPDETSSEKEIIFYNSGVYVEEESSEIVGRIAYDTPTGKKYHLSKECAGKNAIEVSYDEIRKIKEPCKTCAKEN